MIITAWLSLLIDCIVGDPRSKYHPVVLIGKLIGSLEKILLVSAHQPTKKILLGGVLAAAVLVLVYGVTFYLAWCAAAFGTVPSIAVNAALVSFTISPRSLAAAGREIRDYLMNGNLQQARHKVGWIVGRDTDQLETPEITRATIETIAENIVDGIISPLFYFFIGGAPLAFLYRAVNTLDSMIAYKNEKYLYFGRVAAYIDDIFNYIPARITAGLIILAAVILRLNYAHAYKMMKRDAPKHPSPNGGYSEATVAGALDIQLGGLNYYFGLPSFRALLGDKSNILAPVHISKTIAIMYTVTILFLLLASIITIGLRGSLVS